MRGEKALHITQEITQNAPQYLCLLRQLTQSFTKLQNQSCSDSSPHNICTLVHREQGAAECDQSTQEFNKVQVRTLHTVTKEEESFFSAVMEAEKIHPQSPQTMIQTEFQRAPCEEDE